MRENKFRGKRKDNNEWVYGDLIHTVDGVGISHLTGIDKIRILELVHPESVGQLTPAQDELGKDIYENDVIKIVEGAHVIVGAVKMGEWTCNCGDYYCSEADLLGWYIEGYDRYDGQPKRKYLRAFTRPFGNVIGNMIDNPELLKAR